MASRPGPYVLNCADWRVTLNGQDLTDKLRPRLVSLTVTEKRGDEADQLDLVIDDSDGCAALPPAGAPLEVHLGWAAGSDVTAGLVDKGRFVVDDVEHGGPPDVITVRGRSADFKSAIRQRREQSWRATTLGAIVREVAGRQKLTAKVAGDLASVAVATLVQSRESDLALLKRLGREHDAVATVKAGALIFQRIGAGAAASGQALPSTTVARGEGDRHRYAVRRAEEYTGVTAAWHDRKGAKAKLVTVGSADNARRLSRTYASEAEARRAAGAERARGARQPVSMDFELALGRPDLSPEQRLTLTGWRSEITAHEWLVVEAVHRLDRGIGTSLRLEAIET